MLKQEDLKKLDQQRNDAVDRSTELRKAAVAHATTVGEKAFETAQEAAATATSNPAEPAKSLEAAVKPATLEPATVDPAAVEAPVSAPQEAS